MLPRPACKPTAPRALAPTQPFLPALPTQPSQGRKKNASATGVTVGGVAGAAAAAQLAEKKQKETSHVDFYRFQQREHRRSGAQAVGQRLGRRGAGLGRTRGPCCCCVAALPTLARCKPTTHLLHPSASSPACLQSCWTCVPNSRRTSGASPSCARCANGSHTERARRPCSSPLALCAHTDHVILWPTKRVMGACSRSDRLRCRMRHEVRVGGQRPLEVCTPQTSLSILHTCVVPCLPAGDPSDPSLHVSARAAQESARWARRLSKRPHGAAGAHGKPRSAQARRRCQRRVLVPAHGPWLLLKRFQRPAKKQCRTEDAAILLQTGGSCRPAARRCSRPPPRRTSMLAPLKSAWTAYRARARQMPSNMPVHTSAFARPHAPSSLRAGAVAAVVLLARDTLEGTALRIKGLSEWARHIQPKDLAAEWRVRRNNAAGGRSTTTLALTNACLPALRPVPPNALLANSCAGGCRGTAPAQA